jgi:hypothetical protein
MKTIIDFKIKMINNSEKKARRLANKDTTRLTCYRRSLMMKLRVYRNTKTIFNKFITLRIRSPSTTAVLIQKIIVKMVKSILPNLRLSQKVKLTQKSIWVTIRISVTPYLFPIMNTSTPFLARTIKNLTTTQL